MEGRPGATLESFDFDAHKAELTEKHNESVIEDKHVLSSALYPKVFDDYMTFKGEYGPVDKLDTKTFLVGPDIAEEISVSLPLHQNHMITCILLVFVY